MKVLGVLGSPRRGGNTEIILDKALEGASSAGAATEKIILNELKFSACQECENIKSDGTCIVQDDMQTVYKKMDEADAVILASPIFFGSVSAQTKMMIDRFQCRWYAKNILKTLEALETKKKGLFLCVSASDKKNFFDNAISIVRNFFATCDIDYSDEVMCSGPEAKGDMISHPDCLEDAFQKGKKLI